MKGVSAFLRRTSPRHSRGDESEGSGERSTVPSWPDIQFRHFSMSSYCNEKFYFYLSIVE